MSDLPRFLGEWAHFAAQAAAILALETLAGFAFTLALLPRFFRARWLLAAPLAGAAVHSAVLLPLCVLGFSVAQAAWVPLALAALGAVAVLWRLRGRSRRIIAGLKRAAFPAAIAVLATTLVGTHYLTSRNTGSTRDLWGSSDFFDYWTMADYLQRHGANLAAYGAQQEFKSMDVERHLTLGGRLGAIANLAAWSRVLSPGDSYRIINAAIAAGLAGWLLVLALFIERERVRARWPVLLAALHPLLYCLLFFSYYSQATMVPVCVLSLMLVEHGGRRRELAAAGVILGANLLSYAALAVPLAAFGAIQLARLLAARAPLRCIGARLGLPCAVALLVCGYYLAQPWKELTFVNAQTVQGGWEWRGLVGFPELFGIAPLAGYFLPASEPDERLWANVFLGAVAIALLVLAWRGLRQRLTFGALFLSTAALLALALSKVLQGIPNASHGVFKILSQFGLLGFAVMMIPIAALLRRKAVRWLPAASLAVLAAWLWFAWRAVDAGADQRFLFKPDAVAFIREQAPRVRKLCVMFARFGWWQPNIPEAFLKRSEQLLIKGAEPFTNPARIEPVAFVYNGELGEPAVTLARSENYRLGSPPGALDFRRAGERMWVQRGMPVFWEKSNDCAITLGPRRARLVLGYRWKAARSDAKLRVRVNGEPCGEAELLPNGGESSVPVKAAAQAREPYTIVEIDLAPGSKPPGNPVILDRISYED